MANASLVSSTEQRYVMRACDHAAENEPDGLVRLAQRQTKRRPSKNVGSTPLAAHEVYHEPLSETELRTSLSQCQTEMQCSSQITAVARRVYSMSLASLIVATVRVRDCTDVNHFPSLHSGPLDHWFGAILNLCIDKRMRRHLCLLERDDAVECSH